MAKSTAATGPVPDTDRELTFETIIGHAEAKSFLRRLVRTGTLPQAILIAGPAGVGKKSFAWALCKEIVAQGEDPATHKGAQKIFRGTHPDVHVCDPSGGVSGQIVIDSIREAEDWLSIMPLESPKKLLFISPADRMNESAANCLLKILEEPPSRAQIILVSADPALLLPTIRSRCTPILLDAVPTDELLPWLKSNASASPERIELAARLAEGRPGYALTLLAGGALDSRKEILAELRILQAHGFASLFRVADRLATRGDDLASTLLMMLLLLRDGLTLSVGVERILNEDLAEELRTLIAPLASADVLEATECVAKALEDVSGFYTPQSQQHFMEVLVSRIGTNLRRRAA